MQHLVASLFLDGEEDKKVTGTVTDLSERDSVLRKLADERVFGSDASCDKYAVALAGFRANNMDK